MTDIAPQPRPVWQLVVPLLVVLGLAAGGVGYWLMRKPVEPPTPVVVTAPAESVAAAGQQTTEFETTERLAEQTGAEVAQALREYQKKTGRLPPEIGEDLTPEQRLLLQDLAAREKGSVRGLLEVALEKDQELAALRERIAAVRGQLPEHVVAADGDRHDRLAMDFLAQRGVAKDAAYDLVRQINLEPTLLPGFRVWMLYDGNQFGTWVTQGTADMSPQGLEERMAAMLAEEREAAEKTITGLKGEVENLRDLGNIARLSDRELGRLQSELTSLRAELGAAYQAAEQLQHRSTTVHYFIGPKQGLIDARTVDRSLKLLVSSGGTALAVAAGTSISVDGTSHGLKRVRKVTLTPAVFAQGVDYDVTIDGAMAAVRILRPERFLNHGRVFAVVLE